MSAYIVGDYHLNYIVSSIGRHEVRTKDGGRAYTAPELVALLLAENVRSVNARYPDHQQQAEPGPFIFNDEAEPVQGLKALACLDYQCEETEDFSKSEASRIIERIRSILIRRLPGYEGAEWEVTEGARDLRHKKIKARIDARFARLLKQD